MPALLALLFLAGLLLGGEVSIPLRDGKHLAADVLLPPEPGRYPAVLIMTPYNRKRLRLKEGRRGFADREHYAYVAADWRGRFGSQAAAKRGNTLGADGFDAVEWVAKQEFCNGKVGTWGPSALGVAQFATAMEQPPHLVCSVPVVASLGTTYDRYYEGGVLLDAHVKTMRRLGFPVNLVTRAPYSGVLWQAIEKRTYRPERVNVPMFLITGWWDNFPDAILRTFHGLKHVEPRILIGPWTHMNWGADETPAQATRLFFDYWLRGKKDNGWAQVRPVRYRPVNEVALVEADSWPGVATTARTFYLRPDGLIAAEPGPGDRTLASDPKDPVRTLGGRNLPPLPNGGTDHRALERRQDVLVYATKPLERPLRLAGTVTVTLTFSCNRADCDFAVWLCDAQPDGPSALVADSIQRATLRNTTAKPEPLEPGKRYHVAIRLPATAVTFGRGRELRVYVANSNFPRFGPNPDAGPLTVTVHAGSVVLPVVR